MENAEPYVDELHERFRQVQSEATALRERALEIHITERSPDGLVSATVGVRGDLVRLDIDPRVFRRLDPRALADSVLDTVRQATAKAADTLVELLEPMVPPDQMRAHLDGDLEAVFDQLSREDGRR